MEGAIVINLPCADTELCQGHSFRAIRILALLYGFKIHCP